MIFSSEWSFRFRVNELCQTCSVIHPSVLLSRQFTGHAVIRLLDFMGVEDILSCCEALQKYLIWQSLTSERQMEMIMMMMIMVKKKRKKWQRWWRAGLGAKNRNQPFVPKQNEFSHICVQILIMQMAKWGHPWDRPENSLKTCAHDKEWTHLDGYPAALIRMVSRTPQARSCCTARLESNLQRRESLEIIFFSYFRTNYSSNNDALFLPHLFLWHRSLDTRTCVQLHCLFSAD